MQPNSRFYPQYFFGKVIEEKLRIMSNKSDAFLQLIKVNRQLQYAKNNLKVYQQKQQTLKRRFMIKRKRLQKYYSSKEKQKQNCTQTTHFSLHSKFSRQKSQLFAYKLSQKAKQQELTNDNKSCFSNVGLTQKQKYENSIKLRAMERRMEKKENQQRKQLEQIKNLEAKKARKREIGQFQRNVAMKRTSFMQNYVSRIKSNQTTIQSQLLAEQNSRKREMKRLLKQKKEVIKSIDKYKQKESYLYSQYCKKLKARNNNLLDCMVKSVEINDY